MEIKKIFNDEIIDESSIKILIKSFLKKYVWFDAADNEIHFDKLSCNGIPLYLLIIKDSITRLNRNNGGSGVLREKQWSIFIFSIIRKEKYVQFFGTEENPKPIKFPSNLNSETFEYDTINQVTSSKKDPKAPFMNHKINKVLQYYIFNCLYNGKYKYLFFNSYVYSAINIVDLSNNFFYNSVYYFNSKCMFVKCNYSISNPIIKQSRPIKETSYIVEDVSNELNYIKTTYTDMDCLLAAYKNELELNNITNVNYCCLVDDIEDKVNFIIINGLARTGKTVMAMRLLSKYQNSRLIIMNEHFYDDLVRIFRMNKEAFPSDRLICHTKLGIIEYLKKSDILIIDEAQRLSSTQIQSLIENKDNINILLGDELQSINHRYDKGIETIKNELNSKQIGYKEYLLTFSLGLPSNVLHSIKYILNNNIIHTGQYLNNYEIEVYNDEKSFISTYKKDDCFKKHMATIYMSEGDYDLTIGDFQRVSAKKIRHYPYFLDRNIKDKCMVTTYELISRELDNVYIYVPHTVICDEKGLHYTNRTLDKYMLNQIYVLMTRAKCSIHIFCEDKQTYAYFKKRIDDIKNAHQIKNKLSLAAKQEANKLKEIIESRGIDRLVHFTSIDNLQSIYNNGIVSRKKLDELNIKYDSNDDKRLDNHEECFSLSIQNPNNFLLNKFKKDFPNKKYVIILLDPALLYEITNKSGTELAKRYYCSYNAASKMAEKSTTNVEVMFKEAIIVRNWIDTRANKESYEPTNQQAEILFGETIDTKYIIDIKESE